MATTKPSAKDIFLDLIDRPASERATALDAACAGDDTLRARVLALLGAHERAPEIIVEPTILTPPPRGSGIPAPGAGDDVGRTIGPYTIERVLGEGGFGTVYEARQEQPVRRTVALKVIRPGMDTRDVIARFEAERQALAVMDHPSIARVFDAGTTSDGRPYFVMERVEGRSITDFADAHRLGVRARIDLFAQVCMAVQHAHSKGVIHRDLKPSNIMVAQVDGRPFVKVIDFGIAKALDQALVPDAAITLPSQVIGTPLYMAPEQACPECPDIDARADVYSLGVVLYELLAGVPPFDPERLRAMRLSEIERVILEEEPPRPSARLRALEAPERAGIARARSVDDARLIRALDGDLDWVVMRALEKDRDRRYGAPLTLADDLRRYLRHEPVEAGPPTAAYRVSKFARRHRVEVVAGAVLLACLIAFAAASSWLAWREGQALRRAQAQLARADALSSFSTSILTGIDPAEARGQDTALLQKILDGAGDRVDQELGDQPEAAVAVLNSIGFAFLQLGDLERSERVFRRASTIGRARLGPEADGTVDATANLGAALTGLQRLDEALPLLRGAVQVRERTLGPEHPDTLEALSNLAYLYDRAANYREALPILQRLLEVRRRTLGEDDPQTLVTKNNLASSLDELGQTREAIPLFEEVLAAQIAADQSDDSPRALATMNNLAGCYRDVGRRDDAAAMFERSLAAKRRVLPPTHPSLLVTMVNLGSLYIDMDKPEQAEAILREARDRATDGGESTGLHRVGSLNSLGRLYGATGRSAEAVLAFEDALATARPITGPRHRMIVTILSNLAAARLDLGDAARAEQDARAAIEVALETVGPNTSTSASARVTLGRALLAQERTAEALSVLEELAANTDALRGTPASLRQDLERALAEARSPRSGGG